MPPKSASPASPPPEAPTQDALKALLKTLASSAPTPGQVRTLSAALSPSSPDTHALALLCLSTAVSTSDTKGGDVRAQAARIKDLFDPLVADAIAAGSSDPSDLVPAVSLLAALASLAPAGVVAILTQPLDTVEASSDEVVDPLAVLLEFAELPSPLQPALASLISALAGTKAGRELVRTRALEWTTAAAESDKVEGDTAVLCTVALSKLGREDPVVGESEDDRLARDEESKDAEERLARSLAASITKGGSSDQALLPTLEGLSVLSTRPPVRDVLASDAKFLSALVALSPVPTPTGGSLPVTPRSSVVSLDPEAPVDAALCYGLVTILGNLSARRPVLSEHDAQMARLRRMAIAGKTAAATEEEDPHESDAAVAARVQALYKAGVVGSLRGLVRAESPRIREALGKLCLNLVEERAHRPVFVRDGGFRVLSIVIRDFTSKKEQAYDALPACQALAKLVISTPPNLLFPPPHQTNALSALPPLFLLLVHPSATLLQTFESLMALTNLASIDPAFGERIMSAQVAVPVPPDFRGQGRDDKDKPVRIVTRVEELLLDDNALVRRAATELVCNLVNSDSGFRYFAGEPAEGKAEPEGGARATSRLSILLLLTDADDLATRLAASGALAVLTDSAAACATLVEGKGMPAGSKRSVWDRVGDLFEPGGAAPEFDDAGARIPVVSSQPPNPDLVHRGVFIALNLLNYVDELPSPAREEQLKRAAAGLKDPLERLQKGLGSDPNGVRPHVEHMLKLLGKA
ncbi:Protein unc-45 A [Vanrija pseudolonga]|uniref:Protein unc-45 A n=1 Tax=Vanrija pseudolonga TaxID=143232 RepID=A0AAF0YJ93_9TREE|nr:Protein unc-45 A [Vanrija pseudolonga]